VEGQRQLEQSDRDLLLKIVRELRKLLWRLIERRPDLLSDRAAELLREAWDEIEKEGRFQAFEAEIASRNYDDKLIDHGLSGRQLAMKAGLSFAGVEAVDKEEGRPVAFLKNRRAVWKFALEAADIALESAASVVPGGGVITEVKQGAEVALEEGLPVVKRLLGSFRRPQSTKPQVEEPPAQEPPAERPGPRPLTPV
jgi:hypothetical protein